MNFTHLIFLPFLLLTIAGFEFLRQKRIARLWFLLVASYIFYGWWSPKYIGLLMISSVIDYAVGHQLTKTRNSGARKFLLFVSLATNLGLLAYFKYAGLFAECVTAVLPLAGNSSILASFYGVVLPVGISFYTFQSMSYSLDIYFGKLQPCDSFLEFAVFVAFFPQLVAGPILRASEFLPQLKYVGELNVRSQGLFRIIYGLSKKIFIADVLGSWFADPAFADPAAHSGIAMWLAIYAYAFQIFLDFSAYSDIAIGTAGLMGFTLPENFRSPYLAANPREFWTRWHISLSSWLRDYLYIPLGGNRVSKLMTFRNLMITMLLGGLWHGAGWNFVLWGAIHGLLIIAYLKVKTNDQSPGLFQRLVFFHIVCVTWIFFRSPDLQIASQVFSSIASFGTGGTFSLVTALAFIIFSFLIHDFLEPKIPQMDTGFEAMPVLARAAVVYVWILGLTWMWEARIGHAAFIYFQF